MTIIFDEAIRRLEQRYQDTAVIGDPTFVDIFFTVEDFTTEQVSRLAKSISTNPYLRSLCILNCRLTDDQVALLASALRTNTALEKITLGSIKLSDQGFKQIVDNLVKNPLSAVTDLTLSFNNLTHASAPSLQMLLQSCPLIKALYLRGNKLGDEGLEAIAAVGSKLKLRSFDLNQNGLTAESNAILVELVQTNPSLINIGLESFSGTIDYEDGMGLISIFTSDFAPSNRGFSLSKAQREIIDKALERNKKYQQYQTTSTILFALDSIESTAIKSSEESSIKIKNKRTDSESSQKSSDNIFNKKVLGLVTQFITENGKLDSGAPLQAIKESKEEGRVQEKMDSVINTGVKRHKKN